MELYTQRHAIKIADELSCFDRIVITGTIPTFCHTVGLTGHLRLQKRLVVHFLLNRVRCSWLDAYD